MVPPPTAVYDDSTSMVSWVKEHDYKINFGII